MSSSGTTSPIYEIIFLRHAESVGNAEKRPQGQADFPLTEKGQSQAWALVDYWKTQDLKLDLILSSPLSRAKETAEIIAAELDIGIETDPVWMERDNGKLAGLLHEEAAEKFPEPEYMPLFQTVAETGESQWEVFLRAGQAINSLMKRGPGRYLVVGHGGLFNMVMYNMIGLTPQANYHGAWFRFANCGFTPVRYYPLDGVWEIRAHNLTPHLS
jgi:2,3-bisphosphoglycerate-dependent phosphoglycerate mutase